jgi:cytochrome c-type biogenesis protein CcmH/NrfF
MGIKMEKFTEMINALDSWLWGLPMIVLLLSGVIAKETRHYLANLDEKDKTEIPVVRR